MMVSSDSGVLRRRPGKAEMPQWEQLIQTIGKMYSALEKLNISLTHNKLTDFLPFYVISRFMYNSNGDSPLEALKKEQR